MKIIKIELLLLNSFVEGVDKSKRPWRPVIAKVYTDEGLYGLGECALAYGKGAYAGFGMLKELAPMLIGASPFDTEAIWEKMMRKTFWGQGGGGAVFGGMSALDMACWDIKGKALNVPLYKLLGGKVNQSLRCYASQIQFSFSEYRDPLTRPEQYGEWGRKVVEMGYDALKVDLLEFDRQGRIKSMDLTGVLDNDKIKLAVGRLEAIRNAVGPDVDIIVENHGETDATSAIQLARALQPYRIMFFEETNTPLNTALAKEIKAKVDIPIAGGERVYSRWGYVPFIQDRSYDVIQPDLGTCGGISEAKKICDMAHAYDIAVQTHVCGSPIVKAASLHLETAIPNFLIHEHHRHSIMKSNVDLCVHDYQPVNGRYTAPELPGLGQDLSEYAYKIAEITVVK